MIDRKYIEKTAAATLNAILDPTVTHKATIYWSCLYGNPNGDPDTGGIRQDFDGHALVTDVKTKRGVRDYLADLRGRPMYIERDLQNRMGAKEEGTWTLKDWAAHHKAVSPEEAQAAFWDVRMFGAVYAATEGPKHQILGPVQVRICRSTEPVEEHTITITRMAGELSGKERTMGTKKFVQEAHFEQKVTYSGYLGKRAGVSSEDMLDLWEALINGFEHRASTMKGEQFVTKLVINTFHDDLGTSDSDNPSIETTIEVPHF